MYLFRILTFFTGKKEECATTWIIGKYLSKLCLELDFGDKIIEEFVSSMLTQISWINHILIMSKSKTKEERQLNNEYYL